MLHFSCSALVYLEMADDGDHFDEDRDAYFDPEYEEEEDILIQHEEEDEDLKMPLPNTQQEWDYLEDAVNHKVFTQMMYRA